MRPLNMRNRFASRQMSARTVTGLLMVPGILALADVAADRTALKYLLLPPLGALTYLVFVNPAGVPVTARRVIVCPTATALWAWALASMIGYNVVSVILATLGTLAIMWALDAVMIVPPLALALLSILLHDEIRGQVDYVLSVLIFTACIYMLYLAWQRLPLDSQGPTSSS